MKYYKDNQNEVYAYESDGSQDYLIGDKVAMTEAEVEAHVNPPKTQEQLVFEWKDNRQKLVDAIEVIHNGIIYQGDEKSQERINRAITGVSSMPVGSTIDWTAKDNNVHPLTKDDFIAILINAGQQQSAIWNVGRP